MSIVANPGYYILAEILGATAGISFELAIVGEKNGIIFPGVQPFVSPTPAVSLTQAALPLDSFNILNASVTLISPLSNGGSFRTSLYLCRKTTAGYDKIVLLCEGIVSARNGLFYPGSANAGNVNAKSTLQECAWPEPAYAKAEITAGDYEYLIIRSCGLRYIADATVANRQPRLYIRSGSDYFNSYISTTIQLAGTTRYWTFAPGWGQTDEETLVRVISALPFCYVPPGKTFGFYMENGVAGDTINNNHVILERYSI